MAKKPDKKRTLKTFQGLDRVINKIQRHNVDVLLPSDVFKDHKDKDIEFVEPDRSAGQAKVRECLTGLNEALVKQDLADALKWAVAMVQFPHLSFKARAQLSPMTNALRLMCSQLANGIPHNRVMQSPSKQRLDEAVGNLNYYLMQPDEREQQALNVEAAAIYLPDDIAKPTVVKDVAMIVSLTTVPPRKWAKPIASGVYIVPCTLVGVPNEGDTARAYVWASRYAVRYLRSEVHDFALTRPDSNGVWFPVLPFVCEVKAIQFTDQAQAHHDYLLSPEAKAARITLQRDRRLRFERANQDLYDQAESLRSSIEDKRNEAKRARDTFIQEFGFEPRLQWPRIVAQIARYHEDLARNETSAVQLVNLGLQERKKVERARELRNAYLENLFQAKTRKARLNEVEAAINAKKSEASGLAPLITSEYKPKLKRRKP